MPFRITVSGLKIELSGDEACLRRLKRFYEPMVVSQGDTTETPDAFVEWRDLQCHWGIAADSEPRRLSTGIEHQRPLLTSFLVLRLIAELRPHLILLHGNALYRTDGNMLLLLLGDSGTGKTTLAGEIIAADGASGWRLAAEDVVILDPREKCLHPYPRAAAIRSANANAEAEMQWASGLRAQPVRALQPAQSVYTEPVLLTAPRTVILQHPRPSTPVDQVPLPNAAWILSPPADMEERLATEGLRVGSSESLDGSITRFLFDRVLEMADIRKLDLLCQAGGAFLVRTGSHAPGPQTRHVPPRPPEPSVEQITWDEGLVLCGRHLRLPIANARPPGELLFRLAGLLKNPGGPWKAIPGGSACRTARLILDRVTGGAARD